MAEENSGANNFIWAFALIIIVAIMAGVVYYSGALGGGTKKHEIDVKVDVPTSK